MSSFLKDLPCRNPDNFTRIHHTGFARQTAVRPTYTAALDANAQEIINDPVPVLIHRLSLIPKDESRKRHIAEDESQVPSFAADQSKRTKPSAMSTGEQQTNPVNITDELS